MGPSGPHGEPSHGLCEKCAREVYGLTDEDIEECRREVEELYGESDE